MPVRGRTARPLQAVALDGPRLDAHPPPPVDQCVAQQPVEPGDRALLVLDAGRALDRLEDGAQGCRGVEIGLVLPADLERIDSGCDRNGNMARRMPYDALKVLPAAAR